MAKKSKSKKKASKATPKRVSKKKTTSKVTKHAPSKKLLPDVVGDRFVIVSGEKVLCEDNNFWDVPSRAIIRVFKDAVKATDALTSCKADVDMGIMSDSKAEYAEAKVIAAKKVFMNSYGIDPATGKISVEIGLKSQKFPPFKKLVRMAVSSLDMDLNEAKKAAQAAAKEHEKKQKGFQSERNLIIKKKEKLLANVAKYG